jgi:hypothetical protein
MAIYELGEERRRTNAANLGNILTFASQMAALNKDKQKEQLAQQQFEQFLNTAQGSQAGQAPAGMIPKPTMTYGPNGPSYSMTYIPDPIARTQQKADLIMARQKEMADYNQKLRGQAPLTADAAGRYGLSRETIKLIPKAKSLLFPDGTTKSFNRKLAASFMLPKVPNNKETQELKRVITKAATARGLIQSGTVVKDNEWSRIINDMFGVDVFSNPEALMGVLNEEESFHKDFMKLIRPEFEENKTTATQDEDLASLWE